MSGAAVLAGIMLIALLVYALFGGADYGAGFWDAFCSGPRKNQQHELIASAIQPIWEANHVWLVFVVVLLFSGFPLAFSAVSVGLAVPEFLILLGVVLRGSSFVFRAFFTGNVRTQLYWGKVFSISSSFTPLFFGIVIGAISSDQVVVNNNISANGFLHTWLQPFPVVVGVLSLSLFAYLAACYLTVETGDVRLQDDFRIRALISGFVSLVAALTTLIVARSNARDIYTNLSRPLTWGIQIGAGLAALTAVARHLNRGFWTGGQLYCT